MKLGSGQIDEGAANLLKFAAKVNTDRLGPPTFLGVIATTGYGYRRNDGVYVLPIGSLKP